MYGLIHTATRMWILIDILFVLNLFTWRILWRSHLFNRFIIKISLYLYYDVCKLYSDNCWNKKSNMIFTTLCLFILSFNCGNFWLCHQAAFYDQISWFPQGLENLEKWENFYQSGNFTQNTGKIRGIYPKYWKSEEILASFHYFFLWPF